MRELTRDLFIELIDTCAPNPAAFALPLGNTISPSLVVVPGFYLLGMHVALTLSVLAAFLERPFVSRAGVRTFALRRALQANLITTAVGVLCMLIAALVLAQPALILLWWPLAVFISYRVELWWYRARCGVQTVRALPVLWGNVLSNVVFLAVALATPEPSSARLYQLHSWEPWLTLGTYVVCAVTYLAAFLPPRRRDAQAAPVTPAGDLLLKSSSPA